MKTNKRNYLLIWILAVALLLNVLAFVPVVADGEEIEDNLLTSFEMKINPGGVEEIVIENAQDPYVLDIDNMNSIRLDYYFKIPDALAISNRTYTVELPAIFEPPIGFPGEAITAAVDGEYKEIGAYVFEALSGGGYQLTITFNESADQLDDKEFNFWITGSFDKEIFETVEEVEIVVPLQDEQTFTATIKAEPHEYEGEDGKKAGKPYKLTENNEKEYNVIDPEYVDWTVRVNDDGHDYTSAKLVDTLDEHLKLVDETLEVYKITRNWQNEETKELVESTAYNLDIGAEGFTLELGEISDAYEISYTTKITRPGAGEHTIKNSASITLGEEDAIPYDDSVTGTWSEELPKIEKNGEWVKDTTTINWEIKYNFGQEDLGENVTLTDTIDIGTINLDSLKIWKVNPDSDGNISADEIEDSKKIDEHGATLDNDGQTLTIPNLDANGNAYYITFSSEVPVGIEQAVTNTVEDNLEPKNEDGASVVVDTIPTGGKIGEQHFDEDKKEYYIEWTIRLNPERLNIHSIDIADVFNKEYLQFDLVTSFYELRKMKDGEAFDVLDKGTDYIIRDFPANDDEFDEEDEREGFKLTIPNAGSHEYRFVYHTYYTPDGMKKSDLANDADLVFFTGEGGEGQGFGGSSETGGWTASIEGPKAGITKTGEYVSNEEKTEETILWTVTFNQSKVLLEADKTFLIDEFLTDNFSYLDDTLEIKSGGNALIQDQDYRVEFKNTEQQDDFNGFVITLLKDIEDTITVTFNTTADNESNEDHTNKATLEWPGVDQTAEATVSKRHPGVSKTGAVRKDNGVVILDDDGNKLIDWEIKFNTEQHKIFDFVLTDTYTPKDSVPFEIELKKGSTTLTEEEDYTLTNGGDGEFTIDITELDSVVYTLTYTTTLAPEDEVNDVKNTATITYLGNDVGEKAEKEIDAPKLLVDKSGKLKNRSSADEPAVISWTIKANIDKTNNYVNLVEAILEDTIPEDQALIEESIEVYRSDAPSALYTEHEVTYDAEANSFKLTGLNGPYEYIVKFETTILHIPSSDPDDFDKYNNTATLKNQGTTKDATAHVRYYNSQHPNDLASKSGEQNLDTENLDYEVTINPEGLTIHNAKITDSIDVELDYVKDSVVVKYHDGTALVQEEQYNLEFATDNRSFTITFDVGDNTDGTIDSSYTISYSARLKPDLIGSFDVKNTIKLTGGTGDTTLYEDTITTTSQQWFFGGGGTGRTLDFELKKVNNQKPTPGAVEDVTFKLERVPLAGNPVEIKANGEGDGADLTTAENGEIKVTGIRAGRYILTEVGTPGLYQGLGEPVYFFLGYQPEPEAGSSDEVNPPYALTLTNSVWVSAGVEYSHVTAENGVLTVVNDYNPTSVAFEAQKHLTGQVLQDDQFTFELFELLNSNEEKIDTVKNNGSSITFGEITYDNTGSYEYIIREVVGDQDGMTYDEQEYHVVVVVTEGNNGLETSVQYKNESEENIEADQVIFTNTYEAQGVFEPLVDKELIAKERILEDQEFQFKLLPLEGAPMPIVDGTTLTELTATSGVDGKANFTSITFDQDDLNWEDGESSETFQYKISEVQGDEYGMEYDETIYTVTVTVTDNRDGTLAVDAQYSSGEGSSSDGAQFENTFTAHGEWSPKVSKSLSGRPLRDKEFKFELNRYYGSIQPTSVPYDEIEWPLEATNNGSGNVEFEKIEFSDKDIDKTFEFIISEVKGTEGSMSYDSRVFLVRVTLHFENDGKELGFNEEYFLFDADTNEVVGEAIESGKALFKNSYTGSGYWIPEATKELAGRALKDKEFSFVLKDAQGNVLQTVQNDADGKVTFVPISYSQSDIGGHYTYTIEEVVGDEPGMSYDTRTIEIEVYVTDARNGHLDVDVSYPEVTTFVNRYSGPSGISITAKKVWEDLPSGWETELPTIWFKLLRSVEGENAEAVLGVDLKELPVGTTQVSWSGLEKYNEDGKLYVYSVKEVDEQGNDYEPKHFDKTEDGLTVTNAFIKEKVEGDEDFDKEVDITGNKVWEGVPKGQTVPTIWLRLYRHVEGGVPEIVADRPLMELRPGVTKGTWTELEKFDEDYNYYIYTVKEVDNKGKDWEPENYIKSEEGLTVTNRHTPKAPVTGENLSVLTILGVLFMAISAIFLVISRRKIARTK